jgi:hypothetical protein
MRLLNFDGCGELSPPRDFIEAIPRYAILSHTWGADGYDLTFNDLKDGSGKIKAGYAKIQFCGWGLTRRPSVSHMVRILLPEMITHWVKFNFNSHQYLPLAVDRKTLIFRKMNTWHLA